MTKSAKIGITVGLALFGICGFCGWSGYKYALKVSSEDTWPDENTKQPPFYSLVADGGRLYLKYSETDETFDIVKGTPYKTRVDVSMIGNQWRLRIQDGAKMIDRNDLNIVNEIWSEKNQTLYFLTNKPKDGDEEGMPFGEIWSWTRQNGFVSILKTQDILWMMSMSMDNNYLCVSYISTDADMKQSFLIVSIRDKKTSKVEIKSESGVPFMLDQKVCIISGKPPKKIDLKSSKVTPTSLEGYCLDFTWFNGQPWAMRYLNGRYDIVRFDPAITRVEQVVPIPDSFPKIGPPEEGT